MVHPLRNTAINIGGIPQGTVLDHIVFLHFSLCELIHSLALKYYLSWRLLRRFWPRLFLWTPNHGTNSVIDITTWVSLWNLKLNMSKLEVNLLLWACLSSRPYHLNKMAPPSTQLLELETHELTLLLPFPSLWHLIHRQILLCPVLSIPTAAPSAKATAVSLLTIDS